MTPFFFTGAPGGEDHNGDIIIPHAVRYWLICMPRRHEDIFGEDILGLRDL